MSDLSRRQLLQLASYATVNLAIAINPTSILAKTHKPSEYCDKPYQTINHPNELINLSDRHQLARMVFGESRGCNGIEQTLIAHTAINRMKDGKKYNGEGSLANVLLDKDSKGRPEYRCFNIDSKNPKIKENSRATLDPRQYDPKAWETSLRIAHLTLSGYFEKYNLEQTYYVTKKTIERWKKEGKTNNWFFNATPIDTSSIIADTLLSHEFRKEST
jgi:uncharacterized protein YerC